MKHFFKISLPSTAFFAKRFSKLVSSATEACRDIFDGAMISIGGFGLCGVPENSIKALNNLKTKNLTIVTNSIG